MYCSYLSALIYSDCFNSKLPLPILIAVPAKATKSVDLFGSGDDEGDDDDSLFGTKAPKKIEQKAETPKKKVC